MALKDLVAQKAKFTEEAIEAIISDFVRFDVEEREIVFTPNATELSNKAKVLVFLVAQQGWQFVQDEAIDVDMKPAQLSEYLGIEGGSLRPILKDLKDRNLIAAKTGKYSVRSTGLNAIRAELDVSNTPVPRRRRGASKGRRMSKRSRDSSEGKSSTETSAKVKRKKNPSTTGRKPGEAFSKLVEDGFFDEGRTLAQLQERMHEQAILVKQSSLPNYLLAAVRNGRLNREKQDVQGKSVWMYTSVTPRKRNS